MPSLADGNSKTSRFFWWRQFIGILFVWASAASAQVSESPGRSAPKSAVADARAHVTGRISRDLIKTVILRFNPDATRIEQLLDALTALLNSTTVPEQTLIDQLIDHKVREDLAPEAAKVLIALAKGAGDPITRKELGDFLLTYAAASLGADRALTTATVVEFARKRWALRMVTAAAVSNADSNKTGAVPDAAAEKLFRTRTADLLTLMQVGGNAVIRSHLDLSSSRLPGFEGALVLDAGLLGDWLNPNTESRYALGGSLQGSWTFGTPADPARVYLHARTGYRWASRGIVSGNEHHRHLGFLQATFEFRVAGGKVPFGISANLVDGAHRAYAVPVHVYTSLTR